jgi:hypothetical protein
MVNAWENMSAEEEQEARFSRWLAGEGLQFKSKEAKARYQRRVTRVKDAIQLKKTPDRVPVFPFGTFFMPQLGGANYKEAMYDITKLNNAMKKYLDEFDSRLSTGLR